MRKVALLGSTGSIGVATLEVIASNPERLKLVSMVAGCNRELFKKQCESFRPESVSLLSENDAKWLASNLNYKPNIFYGTNGLETCALKSDSDVLVAATTGLMSLRSIESALYVGKHVCVANKESLVVGGSIIRRALDNGSGKLLPIDSEHCAIHQLLSGKKYRNHLREIRLTASGGPFLDWDINCIKNATVEAALMHPTWKMGKKITIDSATLMNKGLEVIEAANLFKLDSKQISVTIHPQSQVHAMIGFIDGTYQLQACINDMKIPIRYALLYPDILNSEIIYDWSKSCAWTFQPPDEKRFPCLQLAYDALKVGGSAPIVLNAANDIAVSAFLVGLISFWQIYNCVSEMLSKIPVVSIDNYEQIIFIDNYVRVITKDWININKI